jgi:hypothetical protein
MGEIVVGTSTVTAPEGFVLDSLDLNDQAAFTLRSLNLPPPRKRFQWADNPDADGSALVGEQHFDNREITGRIEIGPAIDMAAALALLSSITDKVQEARRNDGGLPLVWTPAGSSLDPITFYVLEAEIDELPIEMSGEDAGWFANSPIVGFHFYCRPFGYGEEVTGPTATSTAPIFSLDIPNVPGDVPAEGRLQLSDNATTGRKFAEVGTSWRYYNASADFYLEGADLSITGTQAASVTDAKAYNSNAYELDSLIAGWQDVCAAASDQPHRGPWRLKVRARNTATDADVQLRILWRVGSEPWSELPPVSVPSFTPGDYAEMDMGLINPVGIAALHMKVQAYSDLATSNTEGIRVDYIHTVPAERYFTCRGAAVTSGGAAVVGYDDFDHGSDGDTLNGTTAAGGGTWSGAGDADSWLLAPSAQDAYVSRQPSASDASINTGRYSVLGSSRGNQTVTVPVECLNDGNGTNDETRCGALLRYADTDNWLMAVARVKKTSSGRSKYLSVIKRVAGTVTTIAEISASKTKLDTTSSRITGIIECGVDTSGNVTVRTGGSDASEATSLDLQVTDTALATAGALGTGKPGIYGATTAGSRKGLQIVYDFLASSTIATTEDIWVVPIAGKGEFTHEDAHAIDAFTTPSAIQPRGARVFIDPEGEIGRTTRLVVKARPTDIVTQADTKASPSTTASIFYTPRYAVAPR